MAIAHQQHCETVHISFYWACITEVAMSKLVKKWQQKLYAETIQYNELYDDKLITQITGDSKHEEKLTYFLNNDVYPKNFKLCDIFEIFKRAIRLPNKNTSERTLKITEFYRAFNHRNIKENEFILAQKEGAYDDKICFTKFGIYQKTCNFKRPDNPCHISNLQLPHDFYFYGPRVPELSFEYRKTMKANIEKALEITRKNRDILGWGYKLFDYDKVEKLNFLYEEGLAGKYLKTFHKTGKIVYGGWNNPRDEAESSFSLESFYYRNNSLLIDKMFKSDTKEIKTMLKKTICCR